MDWNARVTRQGDGAVPADADHREQDNAIDNECRCHRSTSQTLVMRDSRFTVS